jgi:decaprenylphospho-beta-D-erythro-pentofuranosid-2-ulose 2-reductase
MSQPASGERVRVLVLGATSAIADEVAQRYASRGARLHLVGRNPEKLRGVVERCNAVLRAPAEAPPAAMVTTQQADFEDVAGGEGVVARALAELGGVDVALVAHGDLGDQLASEASFAEADRILRVNFTSVVALLIPLANHLEAARTGKIAVMTSVAGDRGRPRNYTYGAAKGALHVYLQGVRSRLYPAGVSVTTLKLGPVDTPMTTHHAKNALFGRADRVAASIVDAIDAGTAEAYVPSFWAAIMPVVKHVPEPLFQRLGFLSGR